MLERKDSSSVALVRPLIRDSLRVELEKEGRKVKEGRRRIRTKVLASLELLSVSSIDRSLSQIDSTMRKANPSVAEAEMLRERIEEEKESREIG
jgi:hypothetical protein